MDENIHGLAQCVLKGEDGPQITSGNSWGEIAW